MPEKDTKQAKKQLKVPKTDMSLYDDKSTRRYVFYMIVAMVLIVIGGGIAIYQLGKAYLYQSNKNKAQAKTISLLEEKKQNLQELKPNYEAITAKGAGGKDPVRLVFKMLGTQSVEQRESKRGFGTLFQAVPHTPKTSEVGGGIK